MNNYTAYKTWGDSSTFLRNVALFSLLFTALLTPPFVAGPIALYANNHAEFHTSLVSMAGTLVPYLLIIPIAAIFFALFNPLKPFTIPLLLWLALTLYIQGNFLVWNYGRFDGSEIKWEEHSLHGIIDYTVWFVSALVIFLFRKVLSPNSAFIASLLIALQIFSSIIEFSNSKASFAAETPIQNSTKSLYSFSKERNILFIVLDEFSSRAFYSAMTRNPDLKSKWKDFTYYRDTLASFPTTYPSLPTILTGKAISPNGSMESYLKEVIPNSIPAVLQKKGFYSDLVTFHPLCKYTKFDSCLPLEQAVDNDPKQAIKKDLYKLLDLSLFRYAPNNLKKIIFNDRLWFLQNDGTSKLPSTHRYSVQFADLFANRTDANADKPTFKFLHLLIPHGPYTLEGDCSRLVYKKQPLKEIFLNGANCALTLADQVLAKVKSLNIYDQTTIFIIADHGTPIVFNNPGFGQTVHRNLHRAYPLLMVKPAKHQAEILTINSEKKSLLDIPNILNEIENLELPSTTTHTSKRTYYNYAWKHDKWFSDKLPEISQFEVNGDSWDFTNWKKIKN